MRGHPVGRGQSSERAAGSLQSPGGDVAWLAGSGGETASRSPGAPACPLAESRACSRSLSTTLSPAAMGMAISAPTRPRTVPPIRPAISTAAALILAANPCPCARGPGQRAACECKPAVRRRYLARLSGPLLDRVDVKVEFLPVSRAELLSDRSFAEPSAVVAQRVVAARERCAARLRGTPWRVNAEIPGSELRRCYPPAPGALVPLERAMDLGQISARGVHRVIRVAWTLADLAEVPRPMV